MLSELSKYIETSANPTFFLICVPAKITSSIFKPRRVFTLCSPKTHLTASDILLFPLPFGPTIVVIPSKKTILRDGDIISIDLVAYKNGYHGDCARTYIVGNVPEFTKKLVEVTRQAFFEGIKFARKGNRLGDVSHAIGNFVEKHGYSVVKEFQGHGIGSQMHEDPGIPNYGKPGRGIRLEPGMTLAIEPMVIMGRPDILELNDGWTIITEDGSLAAHYENTILITENEPEILTKI